MPEFCIKMHQIQFHCLQRSSKPPSWWEGAGCQELHLRLGPSGLDTRRLASFLQ